MMRPPGSGRSLQGVVSFQTAVSNSNEFAAGFWPAINLLYQRGLGKVKAGRGKPTKISVLHHFASCNLNNLSA